MSSEKQRRVPSIACSIKYWTANERQCQIPDHKISAFCYNEKETKKLVESGQKMQKVQSQFYEAKQRFVESKGEIWTLPNKRSDRLADSVRELEEILKANTVLHVRWQKHNIIQLVINTGLIVNVLLTSQSDVQKIFFDKSLIMKIPPEVGTVTSALLTDKFCLLCYDERNKLGFISFAPAPGLSEVKQLTTKISSMDMRISFHNIPGTPAQRGSRKLCINTLGDIALCWCSSHTSASPASTNAAIQENANMVLLKCSFGKLDVSSFIYTESNLVAVEFSKINPYQVHSLERSVTSKNEVTLQYVTYECAQNRLQRLEVNLIPVKSGVLSCSRNSEENKIAVGCTDGTVLLFDMITKSVVYVKDPMVPSSVSWHPNGGAIMVASGSAELQCYDCALGKLTTVLLDELYGNSSGSFLKLSRFLPGENGLVSFLWPSIEAPKSEESGTSKQQQHYVAYESALLLFDGGPLAMLKFHFGTKSKNLMRPLEIVREHVAHKNIKPAVNVLQTINWNVEARNAFLALISVVNYLLIHPLSFETEEQLEAALSVFYAPKHPIAEAVVIEYRHTMSRYARRFFHHLLRFRRFEKAFLLAKDIQDLDLFVDVYFYAKECGETAVAKAAKQKMIELYSSSDDDSGAEENSTELKKQENGVAKKTKKRDSATRKINPNIVRRKNKPFKVTTPRLRKEIVPSSYPPPKMDNFMKSLISETQAVLNMNGDTLQTEPKEVIPKNIIQSTSTLTILDYGYV